jgi:hypothetical protein
MGNLIRVTVVGAVVALIGAAGAFAGVAQVGPLVLRGDGGIFPTKLPKNGQAPIGGYIDGRLDTVDGSHPPAIRRVIVDLDRAFHVNAKGLPVCTETQLASRTTASAKKACRGSIVGSGEGTVEVAFPDQKPFSSKGQIVLFNGGIHGGATLLLIHAYVAVPAPTTVITTTKITRVRHGRFGLHAIAEIPNIAAGAGSVTGFRFRIKRTFNYKKKEKSYITASCPTGLLFAKAEVQFNDGTTMKVGQAIRCTAKG